jgi:hypothetical protein
MATKTAYDNFTEASDVALTAHTSDSSDTWSVYGSASVSINAAGDFAYCTNGAGVYTYYSSYIPASADYDVVATIFLAAGDLSMAVAGRINTTNGACYSVGTSYGVWILNGNGVNIGSYTGDSPTTARVVTLRMVGDQISVLIDGVLRIGPITNSAISAIGRPGIGVGYSDVGTTTSIDNWEVWEASANTGSFFGGAFFSGAFFVPASGGSTGNQSTPLAGITATAAGTVSVQGSQLNTLEKLTSSAAGTVSGGVSSITGNQSVTFANITPIQTGNITVTGSTTATLAKLTATQNGQTTATGSSSKTLTALVQSAAGTVRITGTQSAVFDALSQTAAGTISSIIAGTSSQTLAPLSGAQAGGVAVTGQSAKTLDKLSSSAAGGVRVTGTQNLTLAGITVSETGTVLVSGSASVTFAGLTQSAAGSIGNAPATGNQSITLAGITTASSGTVSVTGAQNQTLAGLTSSATGAVLAAGSSSITLAALSQSAIAYVGAAPAIGNQSTTLAGMAGSGTGAVLAAGTSAVTLAGLTGSAAGTVTISGTQAATLAVLSGAGQGSVAIQGNATAVMGMLVQIAVGRDGSTLTVDDIWNTVIVGTYTAGDILRAMSAALAGKVSGAGTDTVTFRTVSDTRDAIIATGDQNGNRSTVLLDVISPSASGLSVSSPDDIWNATIDGTFTARDLLKLFAAALAGKVSGAASETIVFRDMANTRDAITATVDVSGNRTALTYDVQ